MLGIPAHHAVACVIGLGTHQTTHQAKKTTGFDFTSIDHWGAIRSMANQPTPGPDLIRRLAPK